MRGIVIREISTFLENLEKKLETFPRPGEDIKDYDYPKYLGNVMKTCSQLVFSFYKPSVECDTDVWTDGRKHKQDLRKLKLESDKY